MRHRGLLPSTPARIAHRLGAPSHPAIAAALKAGVRGSGDLTGFCPPRPDQRKSEKCHSHSGPGAVYVAFGAAGKPLPWVPSYELTAACTYSDNRLRSAPLGWPLGQMPVLFDIGAELQDVADAMSRWGLGPLSANVDASNSDVPDNTANGPTPEADVDRLVIAGADIIAGEYSIAVDRAAPVIVAASIDAKIPVWLGTAVGGAFELLQPGQVAQAEGGAGHAMYVAGYRTAPGTDSTLEYRVINSWGASWCDRGACWASEAWLLACWDLWPMAVVS